MKTIIRGLSRRAKARGARLHVVRLRELFLQSQITCEDVVDILRSQYQKGSCDGIFLSDISYLGMRLPLEEFLGSIPSSQSPFVVVDGAQALNHRSVRLSVLDCDLYLAGTQKWFQSYHPLRIAAVGREQNLAVIDEVRGRQSQSGRTSDPLFSFSSAVQSRDLPATGETVNIAALIAASGSLSQHRTGKQAILDRWHGRLRNAQAQAQWLPDRTWHPVYQPESLESGILLLRAREGVWIESCTQARTTLNRFGLAASVFPGGLVRLSMPSLPLQLDHMTTVLRALYHLARDDTRLLSGRFVPQEIPAIPEL